MPRQAQGGGTREAEEGSHNFSVSLSPIPPLILREGGSGRASDLDELTTEDHEPPKPHRWALFLQKTL